MPSRKPASFISVAEYLEGERHATVKHEYIGGDVYAMAGASRNHNALTFNLAALIGTRLSPPCQGFGSDMKIRIRQGEQDIFYYPDLSVSCQPETTDAYFNEHPVLIVEVLSPATERFDKFEKCLAYRSLASLQEYLLVHQDFREVWLSRRSAGWAKEVHADGDIRLESVGMTLSLDALYRNVAW